MKNKKILIIGIIIGVAIIAASIIAFKFFHNGNISLNGKNVSEAGRDQSAVVLPEKGEGSIVDSVITKDGDSSDLTESDKTGLNSAVLINSLSNMDINSSEIITNGTGASGVAAVGARAIANINNSKIITNNDRAKGILATEKGQVFAENVNLETAGFKSSAVATDRGGGIIEILNSRIKTQGADSVGTYSTGKITVKDSTIEANGAEGAVIDGSGEIVFENVGVKTHKKRGVMIFYTGPNMGERIRGKFTMTGGQLEVLEGPAFYVTNTAAKITLESVLIDVSSGVFLDVSIDKHSELGQEGPPVRGAGGEAKVTLNKQTVKGNIEVDEKSTVELEIMMGSTFEGAINAKNTGKEINVKLDSTSIWNLTGNSYITTLDAEEGAQINTNGYTITYIEAPSEEEDEEENRVSPNGKKYREYENERKESENKKEN